MAMTRKEIERLLGPTDSQLAAEIVATDANSADLAKALFSLPAVLGVESDEALVNDGDHLPTGKVAELIGILETIDDEDGIAAPAASASDWA